MISNDRKDELRKNATIVSMYLDATSNNSVYLLDELKLKVQDLMSTTFRQLFKSCTNEEKEFVQNIILENKNIVFSKAECLVTDENRSWFTDDKERENLFFDRYKRYIAKRNGFNDKTLKSFSNEVLNPIMNQLGNPKSDESFGRYGLIVGDVQSGKTMNYIGIINKAADAGYKIIVVLTGTIESLRQQTQSRIDEGFTGFDSDTAIQKDKKYIGVGLDEISKKGRQAASFTSKESDFNGSIATSLGIAMNMLSIPIVIVAKKNVKILESITSWLKNNNSICSQGGKIEHPLLLIDDEADNASINTRPEDDEDPTKTNGAIRKLLYLFSKYTYLGYTATPFANVFINPDDYKEELGPDLFPKDFIFSLISNEDYVGGKDIFLDDSKYKNALINNDDCEEVLPSTHKKYHEFSSLPDSLKDALILFALTNVIRDLRHDENTHRSMLINISRYISMHEIIKNVVEEFFKKMLGSYFTYGKSNFDDEIIKRTEFLYNREYSSSNQQFVWYEIKCMLYESNKNVMFLAVNSNNSMINYKEYANYGAKCVFVGGLSLSRGLTLEGLVISYFYRYSKTYDVLFQMGRWFGYRKHYEDLFRIFMPKELSGWYTTITESMEQLKSDLVKMQESGKTPSDFGIRVMNDSSKLKITNSSKMRTALTAYDTIIGFGEIIPTPDIYYNPLINQNNINSTVSLLAKDIECHKLKIDTDIITGDKCIKGVCVDTIIGIIRNTIFSPANNIYDRDAVLEFLNRYKESYFKVWDVVFIEGLKRDVNNTLHIDALNLDIHKSRKKFDIFYDYIRMQGSREQLHNPSDTSACLDSLDLKNELDNEFMELYKKTHANESKKVLTPAKQYLDVKDRKPLLMLYFIELSEEDINDKKISIIKRFKESNTVPFGIALAIPKFTDEVSQTTMYKINVVEQRKRRDIENYINEFDDEEEEK